MLNPRYLIGFTGHRSGYDEVLIRPALRQVLGDLQTRAAALGGRAELYTSVAEGSDTLCVEIARELDMPVHLMLPLEETEFAKDFSSADAWQRSQAQLVTARQRSGRDSVHLVLGETTRPECYFNQAMHMLDAVDVLIAVWDEKPARGLGGTQQVIDQAKAVGIPVVQIASASGAITGSESLEACFKPDAIITELNDIALQSRVSGAADVMNPDNLQKCLNQIATTEAARFRPSLVRIILMDGIAALLATVLTFEVLSEHHVWNENKWIITAVELLLVSSALWMSWRLRRRHTQEKWIRCRFAGELVRGLRVSVPIVDPLRPAITTHDPAWRRFALSSGLLVLEHHTPVDPIAERDRYVEVRLSGTHREGQIKHYREMQPSAGRWWDFTAFIATWSARLAPVFVLLALMNELSTHWEFTRPWHLDEASSTWPLVAFLPIALPLIAGIATSLRHTLDAGRRKQRYPEMVRRLAALKTQLVGMQTASTIRHTVSQSEGIILDELREWQLAMRNAGE